MSRDSLVAATLHQLVKEGQLLWELDDEHVLRYRTAPKPHIPISRSKYRTYRRAFVRYGRSDGQASNEENKTRKATIQ
jgi:multidrug resistance efflux pump